MRAYGVPDKMIEAIDVSYSETWAKVRTADGETKTFQISTGVLQGGTLAPFLFIVALDYALRRAIEGHKEEQLRSPYRNMRVGESQRRWSLT